jgi:hypothetical protein
MIKIIEFDKNKFNFKKIVNKFFKKKFNQISEDLHKIKNLDIKKLKDHSDLKVPVFNLKKNFFDVTKDQDLPLISTFYKIDPIFKKNNGNNREKSGEFIETYYRLVKYLQKNFFKKKIIFQSKPTLRIQFPNTISVGGYHRDSDYGHQKKSLNFWLPFTDSQNTNTLWIETKKNKKDYKPYDVKWGQILIFDSSLKHGVEVNKENYTRTSMDFRILLKKDYKKTNKTSPKNKIKFELGGYYSNFES